MILTIDPGAVTGWALWSADALAACGLSTPPAAGRYDHANGIADVYIERPVIYPRSKARPNDIITLAVNAGEWGGRYHYATVHYVEPRTWKGTIDKAVHHPRIRAALTDREAAVLAAAEAGVAKSKRHNLLDAVGIGLWALGRMGHQARQDVAR